MIVFIHFLFSYHRIKSLFPLGKSCSLIQVEDAITVYNLLKEKKKRISGETEQALLELLAYNAEVILNKYLIPFKEGGGGIVI